ncbi:MAG TPA: GDSL-type esterase/lipase family protein, partial [Steroidobacteraceae bacterium]|nr:GDSL-type esterase/lipase family protein [Steroidobacteraceae bacterium]
PEQNVTARDVIGALQQLLERGHAHGLRVMLGTITPTLGCPDCGGEQGEAIRQAVNEWIRRAKVFDAIADFDRAVRDPLQPVRLKPEFDSGDHLHPSDAGYVAMANAIDLGLFRR